MFANDVRNGILSTSDLNPRLDSGLEWDPNTSFNMSLLIDEGKQTLSLNDFDYSISMSDTDMDGRVGLGYGGIGSITFFDFKAQSISKLAEQTRNNSTKLSDTLTILLEGKSLPENSYIPLYDSKPYQVLSGHIAAKLPCSSDNSSGVQFLTGNAPESNLIELELVPQLSDVGSMCLYHGDISSNQNTTIQDLMIQNNSPDDIDFPETSSIIISISGLSKSFDNGN